MKRTILKLSDFEDQAAAILAASKAKRGDGLRMEVIDGDDSDAPGDDDDSDSDDDADDDDQDSGSGDDDGDDKDDKDSDKKDEDKVDRAEYERVKRHRAAADRKNADLQRQIDELKSGKGSDDKKDAKDDKPSGPSEREVQLEKERNELRIHNAFLAANQYDWYDPADALRLANLADVEIEEDGTVVGLKEALQKLAKDKPHLIRKKEGSDDKKGPSGSSRNGKRKGGETKPDRAALSKTYPVLATRR